MSIVAPLPENIANARMHWRVKLKAKKEYWHALDVLAMIGRLPKPPLRAPEVAEIAAHLFVGNYMDDGNAMARLKWLEDWLVTNGYLANDSRKHLRYAGIPAQTIDRKRPRVELTITPLDAAA